MRYYQKQQNTPATNQTHLLNLHQMGMDPLQQQYTNGFPTSSNPIITTTTIAPVTRHHLLQILSLHGSLIHENPAFNLHSLLHLSHRESKLLIITPEELSSLLHCLHRLRSIQTRKHHLHWTLNLCPHQGT
jgi:hypothetical protein